MTTRFSPRPVIAAAILASLYGIPLPATAQRWSDGPPRAGIARAQARETDDIALLLALRPDQRPALTAFLQAMRPPPPPPPPPSRESHERGEPNAAPLEEGFAQHLDRMTKDAARRSTDDTRRIAAARTFYDGLDPTQRRAFEALMRLRHGPGAGGPGPHGPALRGPMPGRAGPGSDGSGSDGPPPTDNMPPQP